MLSISFIKMNRFYTSPVQYSWSFSHFWDLRVEFLFSSLLNANISLGKWEYIQSMSGTSAIMQSLSASDTAASYDPARQSELRSELTAVEEEGLHPMARPPTHSRWIVDWVGVRRTLKRGHSL